MGEWFWKALSSLPLRVSQLSFEPANVSKSEEIDSHFI